KAIIAKSFARIYFRNLINNGIPAITLEWDPKHFAKEDNIEISLEKGIILNKSKNLAINFKKIPEFLAVILEHEGIINQLKKKIKI
ncbi:MAG: 3-isopropylmalate dehydratase, partial [Candidatus Lokiarchaeota archaeon]|nr:3-isopropylmalate dehydratase [Candidatus Lokiarchaeota archaeon]